MRLVLINLVLIHFFLFLSNISLNTLLQEN